MALKVVSSAVGDTAEFRRRFEREAAVLARLDSPHIIKIYEYGTEAGCPFIATQYVAGGDLGGLIGAWGAMPPALALRVCAQIADALQDAHRVGVVHRDVKPSNVLLRDSRAAEPHAYLCDFGIARGAQDGLTAPGAVAGTWSYLAPECGRGEPGGPASDVYALGCLLWAGITGRAPYVGTDVEIAVAHQRAPLPVLDGDDPLSLALNQVMARTMAKDPADRYDDLEELRGDLLAAAALPTATLHPRVEQPVAPEATAGSSHPSLPPAGMSAAAGTGSPERLRRAGAACSPPASSPPSWCSADPRCGVLALTGGDDPEPGGDDPTSAAPSPDEPTTGSDTQTSAPEPQRVDEGGPISGDIDGDGLGDVALVFQTRPMERRDNGKAIRRSADITDFTSDGSSFTEGRRVSDDPPRGYRQDTIAGDFDGDDAYERITVSTTNARTEGFQLVSDLSSGGQVDAEFDRVEGSGQLGLGACDVDGNGSDDLLIQATDPEARGPGAADATRLDVALMTDGQASPAQEFFTTTAVGAKTRLDDFDGDGLCDVAQVVPGEIDGAEREFDVRLFLNDGEGGTEPGPTTTYSSRFDPIVLDADLDGDEDAELVVVGYLAGTDIASIDLADGRLTDLTVAGDFRTGGLNTPSVTVSDVDGDGLDDLVAVAVRGKSEARLITARNGGGGGFSITRWAVWDRDLHPEGFYLGLAFLGGTLS